MTAAVRLLVSVAGVEEVAAALAGGADVIDLKAPAEGSLGAPEPAVLRAVAASVAGFRAGAGCAGAAVHQAGGAGGSEGGASGGSPVGGAFPSGAPPVAPLPVAPPAAPPLSVALGDASLPPAGPGPGTYALAAWAAAAAGAAYIKIGLRGAMTEADATALIAAVARGARGAGASVRVIVGGFADAAAIGALPPACLPAVAAAAGADGVLVDTARKDGRRLLDWLDPATIGRLIAEARRRGLLVGLAGSLRAEDLPAVAALGPDLIGVRGAACAGGRREGPLDPVRVAALRAALGPVSPVVLSAGGSA